VSALDEIVTQNPLFRKPPGEEAIECPHVINTFAVVGAFTAQILIDVRDRLGIGINTDCISKEAAEDGGAGTRQSRADARLNDCVGAGGNSAGAVEYRLIEGVRQSFNEPPRRAVRELGIAVKGNDKADIAKAVRVADLNQLGSVRVTAAVDQAVQLFQLAPFPFPADILLLRPAPDPLALQEDKAVIPMTLIQLLQ